MHPDRPPSPWLGRYTDPMPIRSRGAFHLVSARRADDGRMCVVVVPGPSADVAKVAASLVEVERVHGLLDHPSIPKVACRGAHGGAPFLELACDAVIDGIEALRILGETERKVPYAQADALLTGMREAAQAAHRVIDPVTGLPICLGRVSYGNVLYARSGRFYLIGFGRNFPSEKDPSVPTGSTPVFQAPEVATGSPPTPVGDYIALLLFGRSFVPFIDMAGPIGRVLRGDVGPADVELLSALRWFEQRMIGEVPSERATIAEALVVSQRIRDALGVELDFEGFRAFMASVLAQHDEPLSLDDVEPVEGGALVLGPEATWFATRDGARHRLGGAQRRILLALVERHRARPGAPLDVWELLEAGWPGESPSAEAGSNRVYVALTRLRGMGLRDLLERFEDGYRVTPSTVVRFDNNAAPTRA